MIIIPFGDNQARGTLADSVVYQRRRGQVMGRKYHVPKYKRSPGQDSQRNLFAAAVIAWQALTENDKNYWRARATGMTMTGYNLFIKWYLLLPPPSTTPLIFSRLNNVHIVTTAGSLPLSWAVAVIWNPPWVNAGEAWDYDNTWRPKTVTFPLPVQVAVYIYRIQTLITIPAGYSIDIVFDFTNPLRIFFPAVTDATTSILFPADDGSTYYDQAMTMLAQRAL